MSITLDVSGQLEGFPEGTATALRMHPDAYFDVIRGIQNFSEKKDVYIIYITSTLPSSGILAVLKMLDVNTDKIYFVDAISRIMTGALAKSDHIIYVESPTMLENIMLKVEYLSKLEEIDKKGAIVIMDSLNSMSIHNNPKILSEFLHIFVNSLRTKSFYTGIMAMEEQGAEEVTNLVNFVCDTCIMVEAPEGE